MNTTSIKGIVLFTFLVILTGCGEGEVTSSNGGGSSGFAVSNVNIQDNSTVPISQTIQVTFSQDVDQTSLNPYTFQVMETDGMSLIEGKITYNASNRTVTFKPYMPLTYDTAFHLMISDKIKSSGNVHLSAARNVFFETEITPTENTFHPAEGAIGVNPRSVIRVQFGHGIDVDSINTTNFLLKETVTSAPVSIEIETDEDAHTAIAYIDESYNGGYLQAGTQYTYTLTTGILNTSGSPFFATGEQVKSFTTASITSFTNTIGSNYDDYADGISILPDGTIIVAGETWGALADIEHYDGDGYIAAFDSTGEILDLIQIGSGASNEDLEIPEAIYDMVTIGNDIYVTGYTEGNFAGTDFSPGNRKAFVAKYTWNNFNQTITASGSPVFIQGTGNIEAYSMAKNTAGTAIYIVGTTNGAVNGTINQGEDDVFAAKYDTNLTQQWVQQYGTKAREFAKDIAVDGTSVYIAGDTLGDFNQPTNPHVGLNPFLLKIDDGTGTQIGIMETGASTNQDNAYSRTVSGVDAYNGTVYLLGTQQNIQGISTFMLTYQSGAITPTYSAHGQMTATDDEHATGIYITPGGVVYVAITRFHEMPMNGQMELHGLSEIFTFSNGTFTQPRSISAGMHASVRAMAQDTAGSLFATGYLHGDLDGMMPVGMGDAFVTKVQ